MVREVQENDLQEILELYLYLHEKSIPEMTEHFKDTWKQNIQDETKF